MEVDQITKITLAWELFENGVPKSHIADRLDVHRETVHLWTLGIASHKDGLIGFLEDYRNAKKGERAKRKIDGLLKVRIWRLREEYRDCCGQKIAKYLEEDYGIKLGIKAIYKVLSEKYKLRSKWKKNQVRGPVPMANKPREVVQMDTVDFGEVYAFTGIDIFVKDAEVRLYPSLTASDGLNFLEYSFRNRYRHVTLLQTDGGSEFKAEFRKNVFKYADRYRYSRPYRKNEQAYIESFNRSLRKECLGWSKYKARDLILLQKEVDSYMNYYHTKRVHLSLNLKTPNDILEEYRMSDF
jgi:transposase InsO family protein